MPWRRNRLEELLPEGGLIAPSEKVAACVVEEVASRLRAGSSANPDGMRARGQNMAVTNI